MPPFKFKGVDFLELDSLFSDDERLVRDNTRKFIEDNLIPIIEECNREGRFPRELVKPMGELGFFGASLKGYGCAEMSTSNMAWSCRNSNVAIVAFALLSACSLHSSCIPSMPSAARNRNRNGFPPCRKAKSSAASDSPNRISVPTPDACAPAPAKTVKIMY